MIKIYKKRIERVRKTIKQPIAVVGDKGFFRYFTGIPGLSGILLITKDNEFLIASDYDLAKKSFIENIIKPKRSSLDELVNLLKENKIKNIGLDLSLLHSIYYKKIKSKHIEITDISEKLKKFREVKEDWEIGKIKKACKLADKAMSRAQEVIKIGKTEREIRNEASHSVLNECEGTAYDSIVASGENSLYIHPIPSKRRIKRGDLIIVDLGFKVEGYHSDLTRTFCINPNKKQKELYKTVLESQKIAINSLNRGVACKQINNKIGLFFKSKGVDKYVKYGIGHGVGLDIHESPYFGKDSKDILRNNMVFTIEPGLHVPFIGGVRIEDTILLTKKGFKSLTRFSKKLVI